MKSIQSQIARLRAGNMENNLDSKLCVSPNKAPLFFFFFFFLTQVHSHTHERLMSQTAMWILKVSGCPACQIGAVEWKLLI